jgi:hypothetical protein
MVPLSTIIILAAMLLLIWRGLLEVDIFAIVVSDLANTGYSQSKSLFRRRGRRLFGIIHAPIAIARHLARTDLRRCERRPVLDDNVKVNI